MYQAPCMWILSFSPSIKGNRYYYKKFSKWEYWGFISLGNLLQAMELGSVEIQGPLNVRAVCLPAPPCFHQGRSRGDKKRKERYFWTKGGFLLEFQIPGWNQPWMQGLLRHSNEVKRIWSQCRGWGGGSTTQRGCRLGAARNLEALWKEDWRGPEEILSLSVSDGENPFLTGLFWRFLPLPQIIANFADISWFRCLFRMFVCFNLYL